MKTKADKRFMSIKDIMTELGCQIDRATQIMLFELPHVDIRSPGARRASWRAKRTDYEKWLSGRLLRPGREDLEEFSRKYMR